jgi:hypothetical protein
METQEFIVKNSFPTFSFPMTHNEFLAEVELIAIIHKKRKSCLPGFYAGLWQVGHKASEHLS